MPPHYPGARADAVSARIEQPADEIYFGSGPVSLQFTLVVSPFLHFCLCDCCSFAALEVSFSPEVGFVADMLESDDELEESDGEVLVSGGGEVLVASGGDVEEFAGAFCACAAAQSTRARLPRVVTMLERVITTP
jgi:hypothetical protein